MRKQRALKLMAILALALVFGLIWFSNRLPLFSPLEQTLRKIEGRGKPKEQLAALLELKNFIKESLLSDEQRERVVQKLLWLAETDPNEQVRSFALNLLWSLGETGTEMQRVLTKALRRSPQEAKFSVELLPEIASESIWLELVEAFEHEKDPTVQDRLKRILSRMPTLVWDEFCKRLARKPKHWQPVFVGLKPPPFSFRSILVQWALSDDADLRKGALMLLAKFPPSPEASERLKPLANSRDFNIRVLVFTIWANSPSRGLISELRKGLKDKPEIAYLSSSALLKLGALKIDEGRKLLKQPYAPLRAQGALALASSQSDSDWEALTKALKDPEPEVVRNAAIALLAKSNKGLSILLRAYESEKTPEKRAAMLTAMAGVSHPKVIAFLLRAIRLGSWLERSVSLSALSLQREKVLPALERLANSPKKSDRLALVDALNAIKTARALKVLLRLAKTDLDEQVRCEAALSLSNYGVKEAIPVLADLVQKGSTPIATEAAMGLTRYGDEGKKLLREMIKSERRETRLAAARALTTLNDSTALDILRQQEGGWDLTQRIATLQLMARGGDEKALRELVSLLSHDEAIIRLRARLALYAVGKQVVPILLQALDSTDSRLRAESALILGALKVKEAQEKLAALLKDEDPKVREAAQMSLNRLESSE